LQSAKPSFVFYLIFNIIFFEIRSTGGPLEISWWVGRGLDSTAIEAKAAE